MNRPGFIKENHLKVDKDGNLVKKIRGPGDQIFGIVDTDQDGSLSPKEIQIYLDEINKNQKVAPTLSQPTQAINQPLETPRPTVNSVSSLDTEAATPAPQPKQPLRPDPHLNDPDTNGLLASQLGIHPQGNQAPQPAKAPTLPVEGGVKVGEKFYASEDLQRAFGYFSNSPEYEPNNYLTRIALSPNLWNGELIHPQEQSDFLQWIYQLPESIR